ncbi:MAG: hypothetical protein ACFE7E_07725 [Candidatus Hodarchaeota archaeon]
MKLEKNGDTLVIAQDIVRVQVSSRKCVFQDILRSSQETSPYLVTRVDVPNEELILREIPMLDLLLEFADEYQKARASGESANLQKIWSKIKGTGDELVIKLAK